MGWVQLVCPPALTLNSTRGCPTLRSPSGRVQVRSLFHPEPPYSGFSSSSNPKMKSRSHHNLGQLPESPEHRMVPFSSQSQSSMTRSQVLASTHQRASSDTDSIAVARQQEGWETRANIIYKTNDMLVLFTGCLVVFTFSSHLSPLVCLIWSLHPSHFPLFLPISCSESFFFLSFYKIFTPVSLFSSDMVLLLFFYNIFYSCRLFSVVCLVNNVFTPVSLS